MKALICVLVVLVVTAPVVADTYVTDHIVTDTTWDLAGSPYIIQGDISGNIWVDASSALTIEPGVIVKFEGYTRLGAEDGSAIIAIGTSEDPILFTSNAGTPAPGDWNYVGVDYSPNSEFSHCTIEYGTYGLNLYHSDLPVSYCTIRYNLTNGINCDQSEPTITNCSIVDNGRGMKIFGPDVSPVINNCDLVNGWDNLLVTGYETLPIVIIDAENNWWGMDDEEEIGWTISIHPSAEGFVEVDFDPWLHDTPIDDTVTWGRVKALFAD